LAEQVLQRDHAICDYEGTSYRARFWAGQGRTYEDLAERIALRRLLPPRGERLLEIGAGFGRLADLYAGYDQVILLDYAKSGLREAQARLGRAERFLYVAADLYHLPFVPAICDCVVTVRVLHHVEDVPAAFRQIAGVLRGGGAYVLEYANKRHLKAILRFLAGRQSWSPFARQPVEFAPLNFDFHPQWMSQQLQEAGFAIEAELAVSHFRHPLFKRLAPHAWLARLDGALQRVAAGSKLTPSIFVRARNAGASANAPASIFCCPRCAAAPLIAQPSALVCRGCGAVWRIDDGIFDFKTPVEGVAAAKWQTGNTDHVLS
jgi:ubiquinone/menaquinone biosynthesis C-methylase UbiE